MAQLPIIAWDQAYTRNGDGKLPRAVAHAIRTHMDNHTLTGWVKRETLARETGLSLRQVDRQIAANVDAGWLEITDPGNSSGKANDYRLAYPGDKDTSVREARQIRLSNRDTSVSPTSPPTSPRNFSRSSEERTSPQGGIETHLSLSPSRPFGAAQGQGDREGNESTSPSEGDTSVSIASGAPDREDELLTPDEYRARTLAANPNPWADQAPTPPPSEPTPGAVNPFGARTA